MKRVVDELEAEAEDKAASNALFQWRALRRISRHDLTTYAQALSYSGAQQVEFPACKVLADDDDRAKVRTACTNTSARQPWTLLLALLDLGALVAAHGTRCAARPVWTHDMSEACMQSLYDWCVGHLTQ